MSDAPGGDVAARSVPLPGGGFLSKGDPVPADVPPGLVADWRSRGWIAAPDGAGDDAPGGDGALGDPAGLGAELAD